MHVPVLAKELIDGLKIQPEGNYIDCTGGGGGHSNLVLQKLTTGSLLIIDRDLEAVERLKKRFSEDNRVKVRHGNFKDLLNLIEEGENKKFNGLFADFGTSSFQLLSEERGFSFKKDGILDMRMDLTESENAKDIVNKYSKEQLRELILRYGEERFADRISNAIVTRRKIKPFSRTLDLAEVIKNAVPAKFHKFGYHPATQTFQALRIQVNQELVAIEFLLREVIASCVEKGGRVAFISFHSLEDRLVKTSLVNYASPCICPADFPFCTCGKKSVFKILTKKPIVPTLDEQKINPLSRSAKLRVAEKL